MYNVYITFLVYHRAAFNWFTQLNKRWRKRPLPMGIAGKNLFVKKKILKGLY
jgi:hypothetical protein